MGESAICIELVFMAFLLGTVVALKIQTSFWLDEPANDSTFHRSWFEEARFAKSYLPDVIQGSISQKIIPKTTMSKFSHGSWHLPSNVCSP
jgi:hypothetical protein